MGRVVWFDGPDWAPSSASGKEVVVVTVVGVVA